VRTILQPYDDDTSRERISASGPDVLVGATAVTSLCFFCVWGSCRAEQSE
jgi:hypothetical protein